MVVDIILVILLVLLAGLFVVAPLMLNRSSVQVSRRRSNVNLYQERVADLTAEHSAGLISAEELAQLKLELQHRLLEDDTSPTSAAPASEQAPERSAFKPLPLKQTLIISLLVAVFAVGFYYQNGAVGDWQITQTLQTAQQQAAAGESTEQTMQTLVEQLRRRLQQQPDHSQYLMLLAATESGLGNYPAASAAYGRLAQKYPQDAAVLAQYAQALYLASDRKLGTAAQDNLQRALAIDPAQPTALGLLGIASFEVQDYRAAIDYWQRLLPSLGPVSPNRKMIESGIAKAKSMLSSEQLVVSEGGPESASVDSGANDAAVKAPRLVLNVAVADNLQVDPAATVFVYARAQSGPRMPLAVARVKVADLPAQIVLDESMAMAPGMSLSSFSQVEVVARISKNGLANRGSGDIEGSVSHIDVADSVGVIEVLIANILP